MMQITSPAFEPGAEVPSPNTCLGPDLSPPFTFTDVPINAQSLAVIIEDTDTMPLQTNWVVFNIPADTPGLLEGSLPAGAVEGRNSKGEIGYAGPCPKDFEGIHRYSINLYALDSNLDLAPGADKMKVKQEIRAHLLEQAELTATSTAPTIGV